jgi:hypothetical protein
VKYRNLLQSVFSPFRSNKTYRYLNYEYNVLFEKYESFDNLLHYYTNELKLNEFCTDKPITFKNGLEFGANKKTIYQLLGTPLLKYENPSIRYHTVLFYKFLLGIYKVKCEIHLYKNFFFLGMYIFDSFKGDFSFIKRNLFEKYLTKECAFDSDVCIVDKSSNKIFIDLQHSFNSVITYVCQRCEFENELVKFIGEKKLQLEQRKQKMMEKLLIDL